MGRILSALVVLAIIAAFIVVVSVVLVVLARTGALIRHRPVTVTCIQCGGRGWIPVPDRTLNFDGTAFVDNPTRTTICTACGGVGTVTRG